jgi:hypothetical protein
MDKKPIIIPEEIHLFKVDVIKSNIDAEAFNETKNHSLSVAHKMMHNLTDERVKLELAFSFKNENKVELLHFQLDFHFKIEKLDKFYTINEQQKPIFSGLLIATLLGICLSTSRGIIFEKCNNNGIPNILIPVVSPQKMLVKPIN